MESRQGLSDSDRFNWKITSVVRLEIDFKRTYLRRLGEAPGSGVPEILDLVRQVDEAFRTFHYSSDTNKSREDASRALGADLQRIFRNAPGSCFSVLQDMRDIVNKLVADMAKVDRGTSSSQSASRRATERDRGDYGRSSGSTYRSQSSAPPAPAPAPALTLESIRALLAPAPAPSRPSYGSRKCTHCNMDGHTHETCFQLHPEQRPPRAP
jgi:hypothetical protein